MQASSSSIPLSRSKPSGRTSRTSLKALKPLSPDDPVPPEAELFNIEANQELETRECSGNKITQENEGFNLSQCTTPTHPIQFVPDYSFQVFPYPTISQLRDYPNVTAAVQENQQSVIVTLPHSAPSTPTQPIQIKPSSNSSKSSSVASSPGGVSVILSNPGFRPLPPFLNPTVSTPVGVGSWENYLEEPTYKRKTESFWDTRANKRIQIVSTDISDLDNSFSTLSSDDPVNSLNQGKLCSSPILPTDLVIMSEFEQAKQDLKSKQTAVEDMCDDLDVNLITSHSALSMSGELEKIEVASNNYRNAVRKFLLDFADNFSAPETEQWKKDMETTVSKVNKHKMTILDKVNQLTPKTAPMTEYDV